LTQRGGRRWFGRRQGLTNLQKRHFRPVWYEIRVPLQTCDLAGIHLSSKQKINTTMGKKLNVTPLSDRVIVKPAPAEEKTAGGIIIPDTAKEKPQRGTVVAAGPGKKDEPVTVKVGDTVLYGKYAGTEIQIEGDDFLIMRESDILAIV
jgi:chaperonin GroES